MESRTALVLLLLGLFQPFSVIAANSKVDDIDARAKKIREENQVRLHKTRVKEAKTRSAYLSITNRNFAEAVAHYKSCLGFARIAEQVLYMQEIALLHFAADKPLEAEKHHIQAIELSEKSYGKDSWQSIVCNEILVRYYLRTKQFARAKCHIDKTIERLPKNSKKYSVCLDHLERLKSACKRHFKGWIRSENTHQLPDIIDSDLALNASRETLTAILLLGERRLHLYTRIFRSELPKSDPLKFRLGSVVRGMTTRQVRDILGGPNMKTASGDWL